MLKRLILIMICALLGAACVPIEATPANPGVPGLANTATYTHSTGVFSVELPRDWVVADTSDGFTVNVDFSPPGTPSPALSMYVVEQAALTALVSIENFNLDAFVDYYITTYLQTGEGVYKEVNREPQPDGSIRLSYIIETPESTATYNAFIQQYDPYFAVTRVHLPESDQNLTRTLTAVVNTVNINQNSGWVSIYQGSIEAGSDAIIFTNINTFTGRNNTFQIVGQLRNNAPGSLEFIEITVQLYDEQGRVLIEQSDFITSDLLAPGEYAPFTMIFADGTPEGTVRYDVLATARYAELTTQSFYGPQNFAVSQEATFDNTGLVLRGQVRNEGTDTASLIKVIITVFDDEGRVIGTDTTLVDQQRLAPGEISAYTVSFVELGGQPSSFIVTAQGIREE